MRSAAADLLQETMIHFSAGQNLEKYAESLELMAIAVCVVDTPKAELMIKVSFHDHASMFSVEIANKEQKTKKTITKSIHILFDIEIERFQRTLDLGGH